VNIQQLIDKLHAIAKDVGGYNREVTILRRIKRRHGRQMAEYDPVRQVGFIEEELESYEEPPEDGGRAGYVFIRIDIPRVRNLPEDIAEERAAARRRARALLQGEALADGTTLDDDPGAIPMSEE